MRSVLTVLVVLLLLQTCCAVVYAQSRWKDYDFVSRYFLVYDFDGDGMLELIALPSYVIDNYVALRSPYLYAEAGFTVDIDLDGAEELVLHHYSTFYVYKGMNAVASYFIPGPVNVDPWRRAFAAGNTVVYNMTTIVFRDATSPVFPITAGDRVYAVYLSGGALRIADNVGWNKTVYSGDMVSILGAGLYLGNFYVLGRARLGGSILVVYDAYRDTVTVTGFTIEFDRAVTFVAVYQYFIATAGKYVYRVYPDRAVLEYIGDVLWFDGSYMYIYREEQRVIDVYAPVFARVVTSLEVPSKPVAFGGRYPLVGFSDGSKTYVLVDLPPITIRFMAPPTVYAGERFLYYLEVSNAVDYSLLFEGTPIPARGYLAINASGVYRFTASATNGLITETREYTVRVLPRPITIRIHVDGVPRAFSRVNVTVRVADARSGVAVTDTTCTLRVGGTIMDTQPWSPVEVELVPEDLSKDRIPVEAVCGDGSYYENTTYRDTIHIYAVAAKLDVEYLGEGTIRVRLVAPDNKTEATGTVLVYVNDRYIGSMRLPALIPNLPAGDSTIRLYYTPDIRLFIPMAYTIKVSYYEDVTAVPQELLPNVLLADVVRYVNVTQTIEVPTTVTVPMHVPVEVPVLDTTLTTVIAGVATAVGAVAGVFVPRLLARVKAKRVPEGEAVVETEPA